ncbi:MAG: VWA domain-containing protein [Anaerolineales bacterium]|nr:VWA domain-containing protein [Anaerolineales bacterium]
MNLQSPISNPQSPADEGERTRRWRLILGADEQNQEQGGSLDQQDMAVDQALQQLYNNDKEGSMGDAIPDINRWLGDIRTYFPASVVRVMQQDAIDRLKLKKMLLEPELLQQIKPDVQLVATLLSFKRLMPQRTRETAREVVRKVVEELQQRLSNKLRQAVEGSINRASRKRRPRFKEINWGKTVQKNLKHYQPQYRSVIPEKLVGYGNKRTSLKDIILCIDQSGSMANSVVYASVLGATLASLTAVTTKLVAFSTSVADLSDQLHDPVEILFGPQLSGGTHIGRALAYCQGLVTRPQDTILVLISDLYEGGNKEQMMSHAADLVASGVTVIVLLTLEDSGAPSFSRDVAHNFLDLGIPCFACTPDLFPDLMAAAIEGRDIGRWAAMQDVVVFPNN